MTTRMHRTVSPRPALDLSLSTYHQVSLSLSLSLSLVRSCETLSKTVSQQTAVYQALQGLNVSHLLSHLSHSQTALAGMGLGIVALSSTSLNHGCCSASAAVARFSGSSRSSGNKKAAIPTAISLSSQYHRFSHLAGGASSLSLLLPTATYSGNLYFSRNTSSRLQNLRLRMARSSPFRSKNSRECYTRNISTPGVKINRARLTQERERESTLALSNLRG